MQRIHNNCLRILDIHIQSRSGKKDPLDQQEKIYLLRIENIPKRLLLEEEGSARQDVEAQEQRLRIETKDETTFIFEAEKAYNRLNLEKEEDDVMRHKEEDERLPFEEKEVEETARQKVLEQD